MELTYKIMNLNIHSNNNLDKDLEIMSGYFKKYMPKKGDIVFDLGSYVGCFTIIASKLVGSKGKVISFEPDSVSYRKLLANIKLNKLTNVIAINKGIFDSDSKKKFYARTSRGSSFIFENEYQKTIDIDVSKLDTISKELNLIPNFIKMDVEGSELHVLKGAKELLNNNKINLAIATYHIIDGKTTDKDCETFLKKLNYKTETGFLEHRVTYAWKD